ncbi:HAD family hydrolase [Trebonia sp.]|uniref:HAD-IIIC family phosphatase n=1 Tax=Trebonia sp. TaxID=2767075 RepID=UPI00263249BF|nr:HAD-IIIC family phosphatase [Trebonia sp.]
MSTGGNGQRGRIKCVIWDLDNTVWDGVLLEGDSCALRADAARALDVLDQRGILQSVASKNDSDAARARMRALGIDEMFVYPQIGWGPKSGGVERVARSLNFGLDAVAFIDDQEFERAEVAHAHPGVLCVDPADVIAALDTAEFSPRFITEESKRRREMYRSQIEREEGERGFQGTSEEFLASLRMVFRIRRATQADLRRAEELTIRTNQLNSTGHTYSYDELAALCASPDHVVLVAELDDRFGAYGTIGLALVARDPQCWQLLLLLMSCRTMSRGVGTILLNHIMAMARDAGARLRAHFVETGRNRLMRVTYAFAGFTEVARDGSNVILESDLSAIQVPAAYVRVLTG